MEMLKQRTKKDIYDQEYKKTNYDQVAIRVKKGKREEYQQAAENFGLGYGEMIRLAIEKFITENAGEKIALPPPQPKHEPLSAADKQLVEEFARLPADAQKYFLKAFKAINQTKGGDSHD